MSKSKPQLGMIKIVCQHDSNPAEFKIVNGECIETLCSVCFAESVADLVKSNETVTFTQYPVKHDGLTVITLGGAI